MKKYNQRLTGRSRIWTPGKEKGRRYEPRAELQNKVWPGCAGGVLGKGCGRAAMFLSTPNRVVLRV